MIQFFLDSDKPLTQKSYDKFIDTLNFSSLSCSACGFLGACTKFCGYVRSIVTGVGKVPLEILRVQCGQCQATHALLPTLIVPYSQIILDDHLEIIRLFESGKSPYQIQPANPEIDVWIVIYIIKQYLAHWKQRLLAFSISLTLIDSELITSCFKLYNRQFMQIKRTRNFIFHPPT
jgi:hypothetical protein